jgi:hypothetical protein
MEQASVAQAITARAAWVAGCGSLALSVALSFYAVDARGFMACWLSLLALVAGVNIWQLRALAAREQRPFPSPVLYRAARSMAPGLVAGFILSLRCASAEGMAAMWALGQGLAMLAASHLLPRGLVWLGAAFFLAGLALQAMPSPPGAGIIMGSTFGAFFLAYAALNKSKPA